MTAPDSFGGPPKPDPLAQRAVICGCCGHWALRMTAGFLVCVVCDLIPQRTTIAFRKPLP